LHGKEKEPWGALVAGVKRRVEEEEAASMMLS